MTNTTTNKKSCKNCKYFLQHYKKTDTEYVPICSGVCIRGHLKWNEKRKVPFTGGCEKWELRKEDTDKSNQSILNVLRNMEKQLKELILIIQEK